MNLPGQTFNLYIKALRKELAKPLPGEKSHQQMVPAFIPPFKPLGRSMPAAVLLLLFPVDNHACLLLIERKKNTSVHSGQISFPGGKQEAGDPDLSATALRETYEETGFPASRIELLGKLTPLYIAVSNYLVQPFVGFALQRELLLPNSDEVERIIEANLCELSHPMVKETQQMTLRGHCLDVPGYRIKGHWVWGATAMILSEFMVLHEQTGYYRYL